MGPRPRQKYSGMTFLRGDDETADPFSPSFPRALLSLASFCPRCEVFFKAPEHFTPMRGVLLRGAFAAQAGIHLVHPCPSPVVPSVPPLLGPFLFSPSATFWHQLGYHSRKVRASMATACERDFESPT